LFQCLHLLRHCQLERLANETIPIDLTWNEGFQQWNNGYSLVGILRLDRGFHIWP